jgi:hypothetical protein
MSDDPVMDILEEEMDKIDHPRRLDAAEKAATKKEKTLTPLEPEMVQQVVSIAQLDQELAKVEVEPFLHGGNAREVEGLQAAQISEFISAKHITDQTAVWAVSKIAEAENDLADLLASYECIKHEWEVMIRCAKRKLETRNGLFAEGLQAHLEKNLVADKRKKSIIVGPRRLAFRDYETTVIVRDNERIIEQIQREDPSGVEGRLRVCYAIANAAEEKKRALAKFREHGELAPGYELTLAHRDFIVQRVKEA